jgi:ATPase family associated with various cellular activities (AAA)
VHASTANWANGTGVRCGSKATSLPFWQVRPVLHIYRCRDGNGSSDDDDDDDVIEDRGNPTDHDGDQGNTTDDDAALFGVNAKDQARNGDVDTPAPDCYTVTYLPAKELDEVWESLVLDVAIKSYLLSYIGSGCLFSRSAVSPRLVSWNRVALLHGPPGSGKTSLSRALAHKLAIRMDASDARLLEIHANSLFSKWFSESSRNVAALFVKIRTMAATCDLVVVLIDEVESLSASRAASASGAEPTDTLRVVNALLTALDTLRALPNVLVLATSNLTDQIDVAFLDRADVKQYIGLPSLGARYEILRSGVNELIRCKVVQRAVRNEDDDNENGNGRAESSSDDRQDVFGGVDKGMVYSLRNVPGSVSAMLADRAAAISEEQDVGREKRGGGLGGLDGQAAWESEGITAEALLVRAADAGSGLSGRALRKLCLLAHAAFVGDEATAVPLVRFLGALRRAATAENRSRRMLRAGGAHGTASE